MSERRLVRRLSDLPGIRTFIDDRIAMYGDEFTQAYIDATQLNEATLPGCCGAMMSAGPCSSR